MVNAMSSLNEHSSINFLCLFVTITGYFATDVFANSTIPERSIRQIGENRCTSSHFRCRNGECISRFDYCDGRKDCSDGSDENHVTCQSSICPKNTFKCAYGGCVDGDKKCDGVKDCADGSDEEVISPNSNCTNFKWLTGSFPKCKNEEFQCRNGQCIDRFAICDGRVDCTDKSDETAAQCNRGFFGCLQNSYRCAYGGCIEETTKCDGKNDCADGSDEDDFLCKSVFVESKGYLPVTQPPPTPKPPVITPNKTNSGQCLVPSSDSTKYSRKQCSDYDSCQGLGQNEIVDADSVLFFYCKPGFARNIDRLQFIFCNKGTWEPPDVKCLRLCKPLLSTSMKIECIYEGLQVNCSEGMRPKTVVRADCRSGYLPVGSSIYFQNTCLDNGEWSLPLQRCTHDCGRVSTSTVPLIEDGELANYTHYPWNAGLYKKLKNGTITHVCGGTLISPHIVITAAHCVHTQSGKPIGANKFLIGLGKQYREYNHPEDEKTVQHRNVKKIFISPYYDGPTVSYLSDLTILELNIEVKINRFVLPICVDLHGRYQLIPGLIGTVVGWGRSCLDCDPFETLQKANLPFVSRDDCFKFLDKIDKSQSLTKDKFCAGYFIDNNKTTIVRSGDSGSGLTFEFDGKHYLYGLVSTQILDIVSTFTDVRHEFNLEFINNAVQNITREHNL